MDRRHFLRNTLAAVAGAGALGGLVGCGKSSTGMAPAPGPQSAVPGPIGGATPSAGSGGLAAAAKVGANRYDLAATGGVDLAVATNAPPAEMISRAVEAVGGIGAYVRRGDRVIIKPNLAWEATPEQAANTSPEVLKAVIELCQKAGAKEVLVQDHTCANPKATFVMSGAKEVCDALGVRLVSLENQNMYREVALPGGLSITRDAIGMDILECDALINVPICKAHGGSAGTFAMKNLMGTNWDRGRYHSSGGEVAGPDNLHRNIADLASGMRPTLNILDATRAMTTGGPQGGDVKELHTVAAGVDIVALDTFAASLIGLTPNEVKHIAMAAQDGLGRMDLGALSIKRV